MTSSMYQVVSECAHVTVDTPQGPMKTLVLKGAVVPGDAKEIPHLRDSGMVVPFGADEPSTPPAGTPSTPTGGGALPPPPMGGPGSGRDAWAAYASTQGVTVTDEMRSRDDVVAALKAAGKPTERVDQQ